MEEFFEAILPESNKLFRYAYRLTNNERDAEDLVQDTLMRACDKFEQYEQGTSPFAWLLVILRSIFINKYRKKKREGVVVSLDDLGGNLAKVSFTGASELPSSPDDFFFRDLLDGELREALESLPQHYRELVILVDMEELSYRDAAEILNIPHGTVMSRLHRARKTLQSQLQDLAIRKGIIKGTKIRALHGTEAQGEGR